MYNKLTIHLWWVFYHDFCQVVIKNSVTSSGHGDLDLGVLTYTLDTLCVYACI